jgi:hypothetical protein
MDPVGNRLYGAYFLGHGCGRSRARQRWEVDRVEGF